MLVLVYILSAVYINSKVKSGRLLIATCYIVVAAGGALGFLLAPIDNKAGRYVTYLMTGCFQPAYVLLLSVVVSNIAGHTKKTVAVALNFLGFVLGNLTVSLPCEAAL